MTPGKATIRDMRPEDADRIAAMIEGLARHIAPQIKPKTTATEIVKYGPFGAGHFRALVAERDGGIQGLCLYTTLYSGWRGRPGLHVLDLYVEESARGTRLGKALLVEAIRRARRDGCTFVRLEVGRGNDSARAFYARLGFVAHESDQILFLEEPEAMALAGL